jgi:exopolysaccharide biosynthesis polyprenyl glycosylphosphotransferase
MLKEQTWSLVLKTIVVDVIALVASFCGAYWIRDTLLFSLMPDWFPKPLFDFRDYVWMNAVILPTWTVLFYAFRLYDPSRLATFRRIPLDIAKASGLGLVLLIGLTYFLKVQDISRSFMVVFGLTSFILISSVRLILRTSLQRHGHAKYILKNVLIVGTGEKAQDFARLIDRHRKWGFHLLGLVAENRVGNYSDRAGEYKVIGNLGDLEWICKNNVVDEVIFVVPGKILTEMEDLFLLCEELGVNARLAIGIFPHLIARATLDEFSNVPLLTFTTRPTDWAALTIKRAVDFLIAWTALIFAMPLWVLIGVMIKIDSRGPILFCQERCGLNGRRFTMYKFRSMTSDAEVRMHEVASLNELKGPVFKMRNDPRITRFGKLLRKTSFDEVPQLLNVIKGDMSIVGPRPALPSEIEKYERWQRRRLSMKPGLTCIWVIRGRNAVPFDEWMKLDLEYIDNWSLWLDLQLMIKTFPALLSGRGAS